MRINAAAWFTKSLGATTGCGNRPPDTDAQHARVPVALVVLVVLIVVLMVVVIVAVVVLVVIVVLIVALVVLILVLVALGVPVARVVLVVPNTSRENTS